MCRKQVTVTAAASIPQTSPGCSDREGVLKFQCQDISDTPAAWCQSCTAARSPYSSVCRWFTRPHLVSLLALKELTTTALVTVKTPGVVQCCSFLGLQVDSDQQ